MLSSTYVCMLMWLNICAFFVQCVSNSTAQCTAGNFVSVVVVADLALAVGTRGS